MIGQTISHYRVIEELGGGRVGVLCRAGDRCLGRHAALKLLLAALSTDPAAAAAARQEYAALSPSP